MRNTGSSSGYARRLQNLMAEAPSTTTTLSPDQGPLLHRQPGCQPARAYLPGPVHRSDDSPSAGRGSWVNRWPQWVCEPVDPRTTAAMGSPGPAFHKWAEVPAAAGFLDGAGVGRDHEPRGWHAWRRGRPRRSRGGCSRRPEFLGLEASRAETVSGGPADDDHGPPGQGTPRAAPPSRVDDPGHPVKPGAAHGGRRRRCRRRPATDWVYHASGRATVLRRPHRLRPAIQAIRSSGQGRPNWSRS